MNKEKIKSFLGSFTTYQKCYLGAVLILTAIFVIFFPDMMLENTDSTLAVVCSVITVIANPLCELLISKQSKLNFVVDFFLIELTYIVICLNQGWYTLMITVIFFWMPIDVISYINWTKHPDREEENMTEVKRLRPKYALLMTVAIIAFGCIMGFIMTHIPGSQDPFLEAFASGVGMANGILLLMRYHEQWIAWLITTILYIFMDISGGAYILLITEFAMLINTVYGFVKWWIYTNKHNTVI